MPSGSKGQKVRLDDVRKLDEALAELPEQQNQEIAKTEAIRILLPRIRTLQSRGYSLGDIAQRLTNGGVPMTAMLLRIYLTREGASQHRRPSKSKKRTNAPENVGDQAREHEQITSVPIANTDDPKTAVPASARTASNKPSAAPAAPAGEPVTGKVTPSPSPGNQPSTPGAEAKKAPPGMFTPRKDSEDI